MVEYSALMMEKLESVISVMKDAETGQRGYLLSGNEDYLEPYNGVYHRAQQATDTLRTLTSDNAGQQRNIDTIQLVLDQRLAILKRLIDKKKRGGQILSQDLDAGKAAMDALRIAISRTEAVGYCKKSARHR